MGRSIQCWSNYWISSRQRLQLAYKYSTVSDKFVPQGGAWQDYGLRHEADLQSGLYLKTQLQYEHISYFPILFGGSKGNFTAAIEIGFTPSRSR
jgi:hypothetical protein